MALFSKNRLRMAAIVGVSMIAGGAMTSAIADQGHMLHALNALEVARNQLSLAEADKAGYRVQALGYVNDAISAVNSGIAAGAH